MYEEDFNEPEFKTSKMNSGWLIIQRLDRLWKDCHKHSRAGQYSNWNADLDCIWSELCGEYDDNSKEMKDMEQMNKLVIAAKNWGTVTGFKKQEREDKVEMTRQYFLLRRKEWYIRKIQNEQGKGTAYTDGSEDDWE